MPIEATEVESAGWWLHRLIKKLSDERPRFELLDTYYRGENGIPTLADKAVREAYRRLMSMASTNFAELVVEALRERTNPLGFRTGADDDENGDKEAQRIWQANCLDADSALVHRSCYSMSKSYVIVGGFDEEIGAALITPEDPRQVIVERDPRRRRRAIAALKVFDDDVNGGQLAYVYLPGQVWRAHRPTPTGGLMAPLDANGWEWVSADRLPAPVVPVVEFANRADMYGRTQGEFEPHLPILNRINYTVLHRLEIATMQAFRQRGVHGVPNTDENGDEIDYDDIFASDPGALWILPATAKIWESQMVDLGPIRSAIKDDAQDLAAASRTPLFYLSPDAANGSAEGASLAREGLVFKAHDRLTQLGEPWEQVMSLAFLFEGDTERASRRDMEIIWASPERASMSERYDAAVKAKAADVPWETRMREVLQLTPAQITRAKAERAVEQVLALSAAAASSIELETNAPNTPAPPAVPAPAP